MSNKNKDFHIPYQNLGLLYEEQKRYDEAEKYYRLNLEKSDNYGKALRDILWFFLNTTDL